MANGGGAIGRALDDKVGGGGFESRRRPVQG